MEVDVAETDMMAETQFVLGPACIVGAIAACRPENTGFVAHIEQFSERLTSRACGASCMKVPMTSVGRTLFVENIRHLPDYDLSFDLCVRADQLPIGLALAQGT